MTRRGRAPAVLLVLLLELAACPRKSPVRRVQLTPAELAAAHTRLTQARAELAARPGAARLVGIVVEPFGSQRNDDVQAFFNAERAPLWACVARAADAAGALDVVIAYDARGLTDVAAFGADLARRAEVESCLRTRVAAGPLAHPRGPGRVLLVPTLLAPPTTAPASR